jgi:hypothetical protein
VSTVAEIKAAILKLKPEEMHQLEKRIHALFKKLPKHSGKAAVKIRRFK